MKGDCPALPCPGRSLGAAANQSSRQPSSGLGGRRRRRCPTRTSDQTVTRPPPLSSAVQVGWVFALPSVTKILGICFAACLPGPCTGRDGTCTPHRPTYPSIRFLSIWHRRSLLSSRRNSISAMKLFSQKKKKTPQQMVIEFVPEIYFFYFFSSLPSLSLFGGGQAISARRRRWSSVVAQWSAKAARGHGTAGLIGEGSFCTI